jgi:hypothetical protein
MDNNDDDGCFEASVFKSSPPSDDSGTKKCASKAHGHEQIREPLKQDCSEHDSGNSPIQAIRRRRVRLTAGTAKCEVTRERLEQFKSIIPNIQADIDRLPPEVWKECHKIICDFCLSPKITRMSHLQRLRNIVRKVYLRAELPLMDGGNWAALEALAKICALTADVTGSSNGDRSSSRGTSWLISKLKDNSWIKKNMEKEKSSVQMEMEMEMEMDIDA